MSEKQESWNEAKRQVRQIKDKLGTPVDKPILETVAVLRLLGFRTIASCGGHIRRSTTGPYVMLESSRSAHYAKLARDIGDYRDEKYKALRKKANYFRASDLKKMLDYLDEFYLHRHAGNNEHIIVQSMPMTFNIVQCQSAETALVADLKTKKEILAKNRYEMLDFTEFLKGKYFNS